MLVTLPIPISPYSKNEGSPQILLNYDNKTYEGALRAFTLVYGDVNDNMPSINSNSNISFVLPEYTINITQWTDKTLSKWESST
jgi:hypothetical protein